MTIEPTTTEKMRKLRWNIIWNAFNSVYAQLTFFGSAFVLFLNYLDFSSTQIGFLLSMLPFFGIVALFIAVSLSVRVARRRGLDVKWTERTAEGSVWLGLVGARPLIRYSG